MSGRGTCVLSTQGLAVLRALADTPTPHDNPVLASMAPAGELRVAEIVRRVRRPGASLGVTRASLSRTLRRLWRDGLVEPSGRGDTMTGRRHRDAEAVTAHEADPETAYAGYLAFISALGLRDPHGSVEAFMSRQRARVCRPPDLRVTHVQITAAGRARLTTSCTTQSTGTTAHRLTPDSSGELTA